MSTNLDLWARKKTWVKRGFNSSRRQKSSKELNKTELFPCLSFEDKWIEFYSKGS